MSGIVMKRQAKPYLITKKQWRWIFWSLPLLFLSGALYWKVHQPDYVLAQFNRRYAGAVTNAPSYIYFEFPDVFMRRPANTALSHLKTLSFWQQSGISPQADKNINSAILLWISFYKNRQNPVESCVAQNGYFDRTFKIDTSKHQNISDGTPHHFSKAELKKFQDWLHQLPSCVFPAPTPENVIFTSYLDGNEWKARVYDRRKLSEPMRAILKLLLARDKSAFKNAKPDQTL